LVSISGGNRGRIDNVVFDRRSLLKYAGFQEAEFDFVADSAGPTLFHCHQQLHMDFGFMALFQYA